RESTRQPAAGEPQRARSQVWEEMRRGGNMDHAQADYRQTQYQVSYSHLKQDLSTKGGKDRWRATAKTPINLSPTHVAPITACLKHGPNIIVFQIMRPDHISQVFPDYSTGVHAGLQTVKRLIQAHLGATHEYQFRQHAFGPKQ